MPALKSINPTDGSPVGLVKISTKAEIEAAVIAARKALPGWSGLSLVKRAQLLIKLAASLKKNRRLLAELISREMGKPIVQALAEVDTTVNDLLYNARAGQKLLADESLAKTKGLMSVLRYSPVCVTALVKPWNYPVNTPMLAAAPALMAGNTIIFKPSEYTGLTAKKLGELVWQAGVPKPVFQVIYGGPKVGEMLVDQPIDMVSFTGSSRVGQEIAVKCAGRMIK